MALSTLTLYALLLYFAIKGIFTNPVKYMQLAEHLVIIQVKRVLIGAVEPDAEGGLRVTTRDPVFLLNTIYNQKALIVLWENWNRPSQIFEITQP